MDEDKRLNVLINPYVHRFESASSKLLLSIIILIAVIHFTIGFETATSSYFRLYSLTLLLFILFIFLDKKKPENSHVNIVIHYLFSILVFTLYIGGASYAYFYVHFPIHAVILFGLLFLALGGISQPIFFFIRIISLAVYGEIVSIGRLFSTKPNQ